MANASLSAIFLKGARAFAADEKWNLPGGELHHPGATSHPKEKGYIEEKYYCCNPVTFWGMILNPTLDLVRNILDTTYDRFDENVKDQARKRIIDVLGCMIGGAKAPGCSILYNLVREWGGKAEATIFCYGDKVPAHNAALVNSVMARSYDFEPCGCTVNGKTLPAHISGTTVPTALAMAEFQGLSGRDFLTAMILGDDLAARIYAASNIDLDVGFEPTGIANMFGATAIAGKLRNLNEQQMLHAFGIALNQLSGTFQNIFDGAHTFKLPQGLAARGGIFSTALSSKGFTGVKDALFSKYGYFSLYCKSVDAGILTKDLGTKFYANTTFKAYPCCRSTHAAIDCALGLLEKNPINCEEIDGVYIDIAPIAYDFAVGQPFVIGEVPQANASFSLRYTVANALLRKGVLLEHFTESSIRDERIQKFAERIQFRTNISSDTPLAAGITVKMKDGQKYEKYVDMPKGNENLQPLTDSEKEDKYIQNITFSQYIRLDRAEKARNLVHHIEDQDTIAEIVKLLVV